MWVKNILICFKLMTNRLMAMYNFDGKEKHNTPRKIAFRQTNLIKVIIGSSLIKPRNSFFYKFYILSSFFAFLNHDINDKG